MKSEKCFVCGSSITTGYTRQQSLLDRQLDAVFVLRQLLKLRLESLEKCFQVSGGEDPADWITICGGHCQEIVKNAQSAYQEICRARQRLAICQKEIWNKIKLSSSASLLHSTANQQKYYRTEILKMVWENVHKKENTPPMLDPGDFIAGDRMADQLLNFKVTNISHLPVVLPKSEVESLSTFEDAEQDNGSEFEVGSTTLDLSNSEIPSDPLNVDMTTGCLIITKQNSNWDQPSDTSKPLTKCPQCDYTTNQGITGLKRHIGYKHAKTCNCLCELCNKQFRHTGDLRRHYVAIHNKCPVTGCGEVCESQQKLRDHQINFHGKEVSVFKCPECPMLYRERQYLRDHLLACHRKGNEDVFVCRQCKKTFLTDYRLRAHIRNFHQRTRQRNKVKKEGSGENAILGI